MNVLFVCLVLQLGIEYTSGSSPDEGSDVVYRIGSTWVNVTYHSGDGNPVPFYVQYKRKDDDQILASAAERIRNWVLLRHLKPDTLYEIRVVALHGDEDGEFEEIKTLDTEEDKFSTQSQLPTILPCTKNGQSLPHPSGCSATFFMCQNKGLVPVVCQWGFAYDINIHNCIAIDQVEACRNLNIHQKASSLDCDFEKQLCQWKQDKTDEFNWSRVQARGVSEFPEADTLGDHTSGYGHYLNIPPNIYNVNMTARLTSVPISTNRTSCLQFWYHILDADPSALTVFMKDQDNRTAVLWRHNGQENELTMWSKAMLTVPTGSNFQVVFEARPGRDFNGNIAIDDISMTSGKCSFETNPVAPTTVSPYTNLSSSPTGWIYCDRNGHPLSTKPSKCSHIVHLCSSRTRLPIMCPDGYIFDPQLSSCKVCEVDYSAPPTSSFGSSRNPNPCLLSNGFTRGFLCKDNSKCVWPQLRCDGLADCPDSSDEKDCPANSTPKDDDIDERCPDDGFRCHSSLKCISEHVVCDGYRNCEDGSDERNCTGSRISAVVGEENNGLEVVVKVALPTVATILAIPLFICFVLCCKQHLRKRKEQQRLGGNGVEAGYNTTHHNSANQTDFAELDLPFTLPPAYEDAILLARVPTSESTDTQNGDQKNIGTQCNDGTRPPPYASVAHIKPDSPIKENTQNPLAAQHQQSNMIVPSGSAITTNVQRPSSSGTSNVTMRPGSSGRSNAQITPNSVPVSPRSLGKQEMSSNTETATSSQELTKCINSADIEPGCSNLAHTNKAFVSQESIDSVISDSAAENENNLNSTQESVKNKGLDVYEGEGDNIDRGGGSIHCLTCGGCKKLQFLKAENDMKDFDLNRLQSENDNEENEINEMRGEKEIPSKYQEKDFPLYSNSLNNLGVGKSDPEQDIPKHYKRYEDEKGACPQETGNAKGQGQPFLDSSILLTNVLQDICRDESNGVGDEKYNSKRLGEWDKQKLSNEQKCTGQDNLHNQNCVCYQYKCDGHHEKCPIPQGYVNYGLEEDDVENQNNTNSEREVDEPRIPLHERFGWYCNVVKLPDEDVKRRKSNIADHNKYLCDKHRDPNIPSTSGCIANVSSIQHLQNNHKLEHKEDIQKNSCCPEHHQGFIPNEYDYNSPKPKNKKGDASQHKSSFRSKDKKISLPTNSQDLTENEINFDNLKNGKMKGDIDLDKSSFHKNDKEVNTRTEGCGSNFCQDEHDNVTSKYGMQKDIPSNLPSQEEPIYGNIGNLRGQNIGEGIPLVVRGKDDQHLKSLTNDDANCLATLSCTSQPSDAQMFTGATNNEKEYCDTMNSEQEIAENVQNSIHEENSENFEKERTNDSSSFISQNEIHDNLENTVNEENDENIQKEQCMVNSACVLTNNNESHQEQKLFTDKCPFTPQNHDCMPAEKPNSLPCSGNEFALACNRNISNNSNCNNSNVSNTSTISRGNSPCSSSPMGGNPWDILETDIANPQDSQACSSRFDNERMKNNGCSGSSELENDEKCMEKENVTNEIKYLKRANFYLDSDEGESDSEQVWIL